MFRKSLARRYIKFKLNSTKLNLEVLNQKLAIITVVHTRWVSAEYHLKISINKKRILFITHSCSA